MKIHNVLKLNPISTAPSVGAGDAGTMYIDASDGNTLKVWDGSAWQSGW
jgi:hypothetical protein